MGAVTASRPLETREARPVCVPGPRAACPVVAKPIVSKPIDAGAQSAASPSSRSAARWRRLPLELALLFALFLAYRAGRLVTVDDASSALGNARELWRVERWLHLPLEQTVQGWLLANVHLVEIANTYYAVVHFPATVAFLIWMFLRRPEHYLWIRRIMIMLTGAALLGHVAFPLAPPRMEPSLGFIDTGAAFGPDVYGASGAADIANQFAAMPSLHIGWAVLVALGLIAATTTRWRWLWLAHPLFTTLVVVGTANHWWLDGVISLILICGAFVFADLTGRPGGFRLLRQRQPSS